MKDKIHSILALGRQITAQFGFILSPLGFAGRTVSVFVMSTLLLHDFDLTGFSSTYLSRTYLILGLVSIGVYLFLYSRNHIVQVLEDYAGIEFWQILGTLVVFFPLMILGGQKEMVHWSTPIISTILLLVWMKRRQVRNIKIQRPTAVNYYQFWKQIRPQWPELSLKTQANIPIVEKYDSVLISGIGTPLGQRILAMLVSAPPKKMVLVGSSENHLTMIQAWVKKFMPSSQAIFVLSSSLTPADLKSLFKTYGIKYVFDVDRSYTFSHLDGAQQGFLLRNLTFPRMLLDQTVASKAKFIVSISAVPLYEDEALETAQSILECYAQRLDSEKTRVVTFRHRAPTDSIEVMPSLVSQFWGQDKSNLFLSPTSESANTILTTMNQLQENPSHFGAVWALTHVCEFKKVKLQREIQSTDSLEDISAKISHSLKGMKPKIQDSENLFPTSQDGAAIVADCPIIETDFDQCFKDIETLLTARPEQGQKKKA